MRWDSKYVFISVRVLLAGIGVFRTLAVVRLLSLEDYALVGIVEAARNLITTLLGFGVGDSISREGAIAKDKTRLTSLVLASIISATLLNVLSAGGLYLASVFSDRLYQDTRVAPLLLIAILVSITERYWLILLSVMRIQRGHQWFLLYSLLYGVFGAIATVSLTWAHGLSGYFHSQWVIGALLVVIATLQLTMDLRRYLSSALLVDLIAATKALWGVSWFMYTFKGSAVIWKRGPFLLGSQFIDAQTAGVISVALDLAGKLQLLQQSLSPLIVPKLSKLYVESTRAYCNTAKSELWQIFAITLSVCIIGILLWAYAGGLLVGEERWQTIGSAFYFALAVEFSLAVANLFNMCVLVPSKAVQGLAVPTILLRLLPIPLLYMLSTVLDDAAQRVFVAMLLPGALVALNYFRVSRIHLARLMSQAEIGVDVPHRVAHPSTPEALVAASIAHPAYRPDIDGLRAIAVLAVVGFHAFPGIIPGGFIGVDVFFVISGFLISTIIFTSLAQNRFSLSIFYAKRIKRIYPSLIVVMVATFVAGWYLFLPIDYKQLGLHITGGAGFVANLLLWHESGYFDDEALNKPFLHLWSLAVEEQFYIFWPMLLFVLWRWKHKLGVSLSVLFLGSFGYCIFATLSDATAGFYSPFSRFWELSLGGILAYLTINTACLKRYANIQSFVGLSLIVAGLFMIDKNMDFPGWVAAIPVFGAFFCISAGSHAWLNRFVLSRKLFVGIGRISYPLYLWHWPLLAVPTIILGQFPSRDVRLLIVAASFFLAWVTYLAIEKPIRFSKQNYFSAKVLFITMIIIGAVGYITYVNNGFEFRPAATRQILNDGDIGSAEYHKQLKARYHICNIPELSFDYADDKQLGGCYKSGIGDDLDLVIIGDSHAEHLFIGMAEALPQLNIGLFITSALPVISNQDTAKYVEFIKQHSSIQKVAIAAYWSRRNSQISINSTLASELLETIKQLRQTNKSIYLIDDVPDFSFSPVICKYESSSWVLNQCVENRSAFDSKRATYAEAVNAVKNYFPDVQIIEASNLFCDQQNCSMVSGGKLMYRDDDHLNLNGSRFLANQMLVRIFSGL